MRSGRRLAGFLLLAALSACRTPAPAPMAGESPAPASEAPTVETARGATRYTVDAAASRLLIYVWRGGAAARLGHNHVLSAPALQGSVSLQGDDVATAQFELQTRLDALRIDDPDLRAATGGSFSGVRSEADISGTQRNLLGPRVLDAAQHPELRVRSLAVAGEWPMLVARVAITLHGVTREREVLLQVERAPASLRARGEFVVRQSEFGVTPLSILGGAIAVQDPVAVRFDLVARQAP